MSEADEITPRVVTLSIDIDDMPPQSFDRPLAAGGFIVGDDMVTMESRNVDPFLPCLE